MKILIVGAGASGVVAAISQKMKHPTDDVLIIEQTDKPLKKILATGNGKCNLGNYKLNINNYNHPDFVKKILKKNGYEQQKLFLRKCGIETKLIDNLEYPVSESAITVRDQLLRMCRKLGVKINVKEKIVDYESRSYGIDVKTDKAEYRVGKLIFAVGGRSSPKLGSDGSIYPILENHKIKVVQNNPGLCPIYVKQDTKVLDGVRVKAKVSLYKDYRLVHSENGEVLFKSHGLSGIAIFNTASVLARDLDHQYAVELDLLEDYTEEYVNNYVLDNGEIEFGRAFLHPHIMEYFELNKIRPIFAKRLVFDFDKLYDFDFSQVTVGGVEVNQVNENLESIKEKGVYYIGEVLDINGPCGGYNLMWAFGSALHLE